MVHAARLRLVRFIRFALVGLVANGCLLGLFLALTATGLRPVWCSIAVYVIGVIATYSLHRNVSFRSSAFHQVAIPRYAFAHLLGLGLQVAVLNVGHDGLGLHPLVAQAVAMIVVAIALFIALDLFAFHSPRLAHRAIVQRASDNRVTDTQG